MTDVLIVGAGPTGLVLALWLTRQGIKVRIIDKRAGPGDTSRAMAVQARTLELYEQLGLAEAVVAAGHRNPALNLWARGTRQAQVLLADAGTGITPYPFVLVYPQDHHERLLAERLLALGVTVERNTELVSFAGLDGKVLAQLRSLAGEQTCEAAWLAGCDGARSAVRHQLGTGFEGGTYKHLFYVADVEISGMEPPGQLHIAFDQGDFVLLMAYGAGNAYRLIGTVQDERAERAHSLTFADVSHDALEGLGVQVDRVNWFSTYRVHHRVASDFRAGRVFLLGDAAHVHSPAGGQGMNTGIHDAINLAWKLAAVVKGQAGDSLLDTYAAERQAFARRLVDTTDRVFSFVTRDGSLADFVRTRIAPAVMGTASKIGSVREIMFRVVSQTMMDYHGSSLSEGHAGQVKAGERLPWAGDNYAPLASIAWQVHVYGSAGAGLRQWCANHGIALHVFAWSPAHQQAGLVQDALYLLRPDTFTALIDSEGSPASLERYFKARNLRPGQH